MSFPLYWLVATLALLAALYLTKSALNHRMARLRDMHWRGLFTIAVIGGAIVAYIADTASTRRVPLPDELANSPAIPAPGREN